MKSHRWADTNVSRPIPKSPGVQCGGGLGYLLIYIEKLIFFHPPYPVFLYLGWLTDRVSFWRQVVVIIVIHHKFLCIPISHFCYDIASPVQYLLLAESHVGSSVHCASKCQYAIIARQAKVFASPVLSTLRAWHLLPMGSRIRTIIAAAVPHNWRRLQRRDNTDESNVPAPTASGKLGPLQDHLDTTSGAGPPPSSSRRNSSSPTRLRRDSLLDRVPEEERWDPPPTAEVEPLDEQDEEEVDWELEQMGLYRGKHSALSLIC